MAWNAFKLCTGLKVVGSFMILIVLAMVAISYYAVVISNYGPELFKGGANLAAALPVLIAVHVLLVMVLWCYFATVLTDPGGVPQSWRPVSDEEDMEAQTMPLSATASPVGTSLNLEGSLTNGEPQNPRARYCRKCGHYKPPRSHHCSVCGRCILKMDHHCVWVVNCVGAHNYKYFLLFILYTFLEATLDTFALLPHFIGFFKDVEDHSGSAANLATTFIAFVLNVAFALSLLGFIVMHISLVASNTTTIEVYEKKHSLRWRYDLGRKKNFEQVFGTNKLHWFIPMYADDDIRSMPVLQGLDYPVRPDLEGQGL